VLLGINRASVRSPAIAVKIWFRLVVARAPGQATAPPAEKNFDPSGIWLGEEAICCIVAHVVIGGLVSVEHPDDPAP